MLDGVHKKIDRADKIFAINYGENFEEGTILEEKDAKSKNKTIRFLENNED